MTHECVVDVIDEDAQFKDSLSSNIAELFTDESKVGMVDVINHHKQYDQKSKPSETHEIGNDREKLG